MQFKSALCSLFLVTLLDISHSQTLPLIVTTWGFGEDATNLGKFSTFTLV